MGVIEIFFLEEGMKATGFESKVVCVHNLQVLELMISQTLRYRYCLLAMPSSSPSLLLKGKSAAKSGLTRGPDGNGRAMASATSA